MLVTLIPFFLAANISTIESDWKYGPEVIYDGRIEGWTPPLDASGQSMIFNTTLKVHCRQHCKNLRRCYTQELRVVVTLLKASGESQVIINSTNKFAEPDNKDYFDLNLYENERKYGLHMQSCDPAPKINFIKLLSNQLNITMNWTEGDESEIEEYSTLGTCKAKNNIILKKAIGDFLVRADTSPHKIIIKPQLKDATSTLLSEITRTRNVSSCYVQFTTYKGIDMQLKSSTSHMIITAGDFTSYTENELIFTNRWDHKGGRIARERITLRLDRIVPASTPLPEACSPSGTCDQKIFDLFPSAGFTYLIKKPQKLFDFWLTAASKKKQQLNN